MNSIHKDLGLPFRYRAKTEIKGMLRLGNAYHESSLVELKMMVTETIGQETVFGVKVSDLPKYKKIDKITFKDIAWYVIEGNVIPNSLRRHIYS